MQQLKNHRLKSSLFPENSFGMFIFFLPEEVSVCCSVIGAGSSVPRFIFVLGFGESFIGERSGEAMIVSMLRVDGRKAPSSANQSGSGCI